MLSRHLSPKPEMGSRRKVDGMSSPLKEAPPHVRRLLRLLGGDTRRRSKAGPGLVLAEGPHLLEEALRANLSLRLLVLSPRAQRALPQEVLRLGEARAEESWFVTDDALLHLADTKTPRGVISVVELPVTPLADARHGRYLALFEVRDPRNVGAIARSALAGGMDGVVGVDGAPFTDGKAVRASQGALLRLPAWSMPETAFLEWLRPAPRLYVAVPRAGHRPWEVDLRKDGVILLGSEGQGVPERLIRYGTPVTVPLAAGVESLSVAAAAACLVYETVRQRAQGEDSNGS